MRAVLLALVLLATLVPVARAETVPGEVVVGFEAGADARTRAGARAAIGAKVGRRYPGLEVLRIAAGADVRAAADELAALQGVRFAEPNFVYRVATTPNDTFYAARQWHLPRTDAPWAWDYVTGSSAVRVAIVDSGIDRAHDDLVQNVWTNPGETANGGDDDGNGFADDLAGWDFVGGDNSPDDEGTLGHGTHVAGVLGARGNNAKGVAGMAWVTSLIPLRACDAAGTCTTARQAAAINLARAYGARVVNLSVEGADFSQAVANAIAASPDALFVAAAGNGSHNNDQTPTYPCSLPAANLICVAATDGDADDSLSDTTNWGVTSVDLGAPGGQDTLGRGIFATYPGGNLYVEKKGTSFAAPQVSGTAALMWSMVPAASVATVREAILSTAQPRGLPVATSGRLNAFRAVVALDTEPPETVLDSTEPSPTRSTTATYTFHTTDPIPHTGFECRLDSAPFTPCTSPKVYSNLTEGAHTFAVRAVDPHPNADPTPATAPLVVDVTGPRAAFSAAPPAATPDPAAHFAWTFDEGATDVACSLDDGPFDPCANSFDTTIADDGEHALRVRATDALGNVAITTRTWRLDRRPPVAQITGAPAGTIDARTAEVTFTADEAATFQCRLDDTAFAACSSPAAFTGLADGPHTIDVRAIDPAGNVSDPVSAAFTVDARPVATITSGPPALTRATTARFVFAADVDATFECALDGLAFAACASPLTLSMLIDGTHEFAVRAVDDQDRRGPTDTTSWTVDTTGPAVSLVGGPAGTVTSPTATFQFTADDPDATFECRLDAAESIDCVSPYVITGLGAGGHTFAVRGTDALGNQGAQATRQFTFAPPATPTPSPTPTAPDGEITIEDEPPPRPSRPTALARAAARRFGGRTRAEAARVGPFSVPYRATAGGDVVVRIMAGKTRVGGARTEILRPSVTLVRIALTPRGARALRRTRAPALRIIAIAKPFIGAAVRVTRVAKLAR